MSLWNFALYGTDWLGSKLLDKYNLAFSSPVFSNAATTVMTLPLFFLLPIYIVGRKDAELVAETPGPKNAVEQGWNPSQHLRGRTSVLLVRTGGGSRGNREFRVVAGTAG